MLYRRPHLLKPFVNRCAEGLIFTIGNAIIGRVEEAEISKLVRPWQTLCYIRLLNAGNPGRNVAAIDSARSRKFGRASWVSVESVVLEHLISRITARHRIDDDIAWLSIVVD